jgi:type IV pilus assembly protein PilE
MQVNRERGFSLVELMLVMLIIIIAIAISVPTYTGYMIRVHRADVKKEMTVIAQRLAAYRLANNDYGANSSNATNVLLSSAIHGGTGYPVTGTTYYDLQITPNPTTSWTLRAVPVANTIQGTDGDIKLNNQGWHCWTQGNGNCTLSAPSSWD